jgi:transcriptional regulator with XRE-family HTH domain
MRRDEHDHWRALGDFIRTQRQLRELSLRQLATLAKVSNPYLSQLERGMYRPSVEVLKNIALGLRVSTETMLVQAGLLAESRPNAAADLESAVRLDPHLTTEQKEALLSVYRGFRGRATSPPSHRNRSAGTARTRNPGTPRARKASAPAPTRTSRSPRVR